MGPSRALRLVARDRARRNPGSRPAHAAIHQGNAWWDAKLVSILGTGSAAAEAKGAAPNREAGPPGLLIALVAAVAVNCGAGLGLAGWGTLQALGVVAEPAIEKVQRQQASLIAQLGAAVQELKAAVAGIGARVYSAEDRDEANTRRMAELDAALGVLRSGLDEMRAAQAAEQSWREPVRESPRRDRPPARLARRAEQEPSAGSGGDPSPDRSNGAGHAPPPSARCDSRCDPGARVAPCVARAGKFTGRERAYHQPDAGSLMGSLGCPLTEPWIRMRMRGRSPRTFAAPSLSLARRNGRPQLA